jgi:hypothetical protein
MPKLKKISPQPKVSLNAFVTTLSKEDFDLCHHDATFLKAFAVSVPRYCDKFTRSVLKYLVAVPFRQPLAASLIKIDFIFSFLDEEFKQLKEHNKTLPKQRAVKKIPTKANEILRSLSWLSGQGVIKWDERNYTYSLHGYIYDNIAEAKDFTEPDDIIEVKDSIKADDIQDSENKNEDPPSENYMRVNSLFFPNDSELEKKTLSPKKRPLSSSALEGDQPQIKKSTLVKTTKRLQFKFSDNTLEEKTELKGEDISAKIRIPSS